MAFQPDLFDIEDWLKLEDDNMLQKICSIFDDDGLLVAQYKTRVYIVPEGNSIPYGSAKGKLQGSAPALYRTFNYDDEGNQIASVPIIAEWGQACEDAATGGILDPEFPGGIPAGLKIATSESFRVSSDIVAGVEDTVGEYEIPADVLGYLRYVHVDSCNRGLWKVYKDASHVMSRTTTWTRFSETFDFSTANGGIKFEAGEKIILKAENISDTEELFEGVFVIVLTPA